MVTVSGQVAGDDRSQTPPLYCNHVRQPSFNNGGGPLVGTVVSASVISMTAYMCPVGRVSDGAPYSYGNANPSIASEHPTPVKMNVVFRNPKDTANMEIGKTVSLFGDVIDLVGSHQGDKARDHDVLILTDARFSD